MSRILFWGGLFSAVPYMIISDGIYHGLLYGFNSLFDSIPLLLDVILDYLSRHLLIPIALYVFYKKLNMHWSLSLFMFSTFAGIGYLGKAVGKSQVIAF